GGERPRLLLARQAGGLPEVHDDDAAAQRGEIEAAGEVEPRQVELRRGHDATLVDLLRDPGPVPVRHLPHEQRQQGDDSGGGEDAQDAHQTMWTVVPMSTWSNSHSASGTCIRMQPCDALYPIDVGSSVPWMPTPGTESPIQRVPSGLSGPGGTGFSPLAQSSWIGGYHHGSFHFTMMWKVPAGVGEIAWPVATGN